MSVENRTTITNSGGSVDYVNGISNSPAPLPFFSQIVWAGNTAYLSGQIGLDPETMKLVEGGVVKETEKTLENIEVVLKAVGLGFQDVAKVSIYLTEIENFPLMNEIYSKIFTDSRPARETVVVKELALGAKVEITMTAYRSDSR